MLILSRRDVLELLSPRDCIDAVERAFRLHAAGGSLGPACSEYAPATEAFTSRPPGSSASAAISRPRSTPTSPTTRAALGLPSIQGTVVLADASTGAPLALMDSGSVTALRTGAATAVAARFLARRDSQTVTLVGAGVQGEFQLAALAEVLPLRRAWVLDIDPARAERFAARAEGRLGFPVEAARDLRMALRESDVCVTCTPSRVPLVAAADVGPGTFVAAVGADSQGKQELDPKLVATATLVVDVLEQCAEIGELQHALAAGLITRAGVHAELADVVTGRSPGRTRADEITVFDSSGTALEDVAAAIALYENARAIGRGTDVTLDADVLGAPGAR